MTFPLSPPLFLLISPHLGCAEIPPLRTARKGSVLAAKAVETQFRKGSALLGLGEAEGRVGDVDEGRVTVRRPAVPFTGPPHRAAAGWGLALPLGQRSRADHPASGVKG